MLGEPPANEDDTEAHLRHTWGQARAESGGMASDDPPKLFTDAFLHGLHAKAVR